MKQVLENLRTGEIAVEDVPVPEIKDGYVLVRNHYSLISTGTEGGTVQLGKMGYLGKARARPEQVKKVIDAIKTEGLIATWQAVSRTLDVPITLGYSTAGEVVQTGGGATDLAIGQRVACGGGGMAVHAEYVLVPRNLCVPLPDDADLRLMAFTTLGSIAIQGVRVADVRVGETVMVIGLGLVGLLTAAILKAAGIRVIGVDTSAKATDFAQDQGYCDIALLRSAENLHEKVLAATDGFGVDAAIITAAAPNNDPIVLAGEAVRFKGKVAVVGRTEMTAPRDTFLFKELELRTSLAYGPGTDDPSYEKAGYDYPIGYVRWTENRNMQSFTRLVQSGHIDLKPLITHEFEIDQAAQAYALITNPSAEHVIGILLKYPVDASKLSTRVIPLPAIKTERKAKPDQIVRIGVLGAGSFATNFMLPVLNKTPQCHFRGIASATGTRAAALGKKYGFAFVASDPSEVINDPETDAIFILTRHDTHARFAIEAMAAGKHVYVEKPMAMTHPDLDAIRAARQASGKNIMVGYNRRFCAYGQQLHQAFKDHAQPLAVLYRGNVGYRPPEHWLHDPVQGGGVILGEACHYIDFCCYLIGAPPQSVTTQCLQGTGERFIPEDNVIIAITFEDGSVAVVNYLSNGSKRASRERVEVFGDNMTAVFEDFRALHIKTTRGSSVTRRAWINPDKGFAASVNYFINAIENGTNLNELFESQWHATRITIDAAKRASVAEKN